MVEGASDLLAIAALEDLRVDLQGDFRVGVADLGDDVDGYAAVVQDASELAHALPGAGE